MSNPITLEAQAVAAGLRDSAVVAGGALGGRMNQAAALIEKLTPEESEEAPKSLADRVQELRERLFVPMNLAYVSAEALDIDTDTHLRMTLQHAYELIDRIAWDMDELSGDVGKLENNLAGSVSEMQGAGQDGAQ